MRHLPFLLILLCGILTRFLTVDTFSALPLFAHPAGPDIAEYIRHATAVLHGETLPAEEFIHAPLYGFFLAGLFKITNGSFFAVRFLQSLLVLLAGIPLFGILASAFRNERGAARWIPHVFFALYSLYPPFLVWQSDFYAENLLLVFLLPSLWLFHHAGLHLPGSRRNLLLGTAGGVLGLAVLTHPVAIFFVLAAGLYILLTNDGTARTGAVLFFAGALLLVVAPYSFLLSARTGKFVPVQQNSAFNLYLGNHEDSTGTCSIPPGDAWNEIHSRADLSSSGPDAWFLAQTRHLYLAHPGKAALLLLKKGVMAFHPRELTTWSDVSVLGLTFPHRAANFPWFALIALPGLAAVFIGLFRQDFRKKYLLFLLLGGSVLAAQILLVTAGRYRIGLTVSLMAFAPWFCLVVLPGAFREKRYMAGSAALAGAAILIFLPVYTPDKEKEKTVAEIILAEASTRAGELEQAERLYRTVLTKEPANTSVLNSLGTLLLEKGNSAEAEGCFSLAFHAAPQFPLAPMNLGKLAAGRGDPAEAVRYYLYALKRSKGTTSAVICFNIGELHQNSGRNDEALFWYEKAFRLDPLSPLPLRNQAILLMEQGDFSKAEKSLEQALRLDPADSQRVLDLAYLRFVSGRKDEARRMLQTVLVKTPGNPRALELGKLFSSGSETDLNPGR